MQPRFLILLILITSLLSACSVSESTPTLSVSIDPTPTTPSLQVAHDLTYALSREEGGETWALDIYAPGESGDLPVVVFLHGFDALKEGHIKESQAIAEGGAIVYTLNWPTWIEDLAEREGGKGFREMFEVVACGIHYAVETAMDYGGDPSRMTLVGFSYGGYLGAWIGLGSEDVASSWEAYHQDGDGPPKQVDCVRDQGAIQVDAVIGIGGAYFIAEKFEGDNQELWAIISPLAYLGRDPSLQIRLLHGERDTRVEREYSQRFKDTLVEAGYDTDLIMYDGIHRVPPDLTAEIVQRLAGRSE